MVREPSSPGAFAAVWLLGLLSFLGSALAVFSQEAPEDPELANLQASFEAAYARIHEPIANLNAAYARALDGMFKSESAAGHLDEALQVKAEIDGFGDGSEFDVERFGERATENRELSAMRRKYLAERERLRNLSRGSREKLLKDYQTALNSIQQARTRDGAVEVALAARNIREALDKDPRFVEGPEVPSGNRSFEGRVHFVAKGDVEMQWNGSRLSFRNVSDDRDKYIDGTSVPQMMRAGDVLTFRMRATAVFRSFILAIESEDDKIAVPIVLDDYRYLGVDLDERDLNLDPEAILQVIDKPEPGEPDNNMAEMWNEKSVSEISHRRSEWAKSGPSADWHTYVVVIRQDMFTPIGNEEASP